MEIVGVGDVDVVLVTKKSFRVSGPVGVGQTCEVDGDWVSGLSRFDVRVKLLNAMMVMAQRMGMLREVAQRDDTNCYSSSFSASASMLNGLKLCCCSLSKRIYSDAEEAEQESGASEIGHCRPVHISVGTCQSLM